MQVRILPPLPITRSPERAYSYLLGIYLGDGHIGRANARAKTAYRLQIYLNAKQHDVIARVVAAIGTIMPDRSVTSVPHTGAIALSIYSSAWPWLFPQHGPGRKHTRVIRLEPWQAAVVQQCPEEFLRGLIESDGCRHRRMVGGRNYPAYAFKNHSTDILGLFTWACDLVGLRWRRANRVTISIARRPEVARLDAMFGVTSESPSQPGTPMTDPAGSC
ncbi:MAG: hypothetical protein HYU41_17575 [Candidatus Rokubacteria bacterium]|nr:hypothetical protein [Candidatus Rokubacteria bacterium]